LHDGFFVRYVIFVGVVDGRGRIRRGAERGLELGGVTVTWAGEQWKDDRIAESVMPHEVAARGGWVKAEKLKG
jgi:hypothetical protein